MTNIMQKVKKMPARLLAQTLMALALVWAMSLPALAFATEGEATENGIEGTESVLPQAALTEFFVVGAITIEDDDFAREWIAAQQSEKKIWVLFSSIDSDTPLGHCNLRSMMNDPEKSSGIAPWTFSAPTYTYTPKSHFSTWSGTGTLVASIDAHWRDFVKLTLNGTTLTQDSHFTVTDGSTIITLQESYLKSLPAGDYTLTAHFAGGQTVDLPLKIPVYLPQTGDTSLAVAGIAVLCALAGVGILGVAALQRHRKAGQ